MKNTNTNYSKINLNEKASNTHKYLKKDLESFNTEIDTQEQREYNFIRACVLSVIRSKVNNSDMKSVEFERTKTELKRFKTMQDLNRASGTTLTVELISLAYEIFQQAKSKYPECIDSALEMKDIQKKIPYTTKNKYKDHWLLSNKFGSVIPLDIRYKELYRIIMTSCSNYVTQFSNYCDRDTSETLIIRNIDNFIPEIRKRAYITNPELFKIGNVLHNYQKTEYYIISELCKKDFRYQAYISVVVFMKTVCETNNYNQYSNMALIIGISNGTLLKLRKNLMNDINDLYLKLMKETNLSQVYLEKAFNDIIDIVSLKR